MGTITGAALSNINEEQLLEWQLSFLMKLFNSTAPNSRFTRFQAETAMFLIKRFQGCTQRLA